MTHPIVAQFVRSEHHENSQLECTRYRWFARQMGSSFPRHVQAFAQDSWQVLTFQGKIGQGFGAFPARLGISIVITPK